MDAGQQRAAKMKIEQALQELAVLADRFGFKPREERLAQTVAAQMSVVWSDLIDIHSQQMRGYGEVNPATAQILDPAAAHFAQVSMELSQLFSSAPASGEANTQG